MQIRSPLTREGTLGVLRREMAAGGQGSFVGEVDEKGFLIRQVNAYRSAFLPSMRGRVLVDGRGTVLEIRMLPHRQVVLFLAIWYLFLLLFAAVVLALGAGAQRLVTLLPVGLGTATWVLSARVFESDCRWTASALEEALGGGRGGSSSTVPRKPAVRTEQAGDREAIRRIHEEAFGRRDEADLVDALRRSGNLPVSLVALEAKYPVGHIAFSPVTVDGPPAAPPAVGLAPVAVLPRLQGRGIGSRLVEAGLEECRRLGYGLVFVLGHPGYYPRFGFTPAVEAGLRWEHDAPAEAFLVKEILAGSLARAGGGVVRFSREFEGLT